MYDLDCISSFYNISFFYNNIENELNQYSSLTHSLEYSVFFLHRPLKEDRYTPCSWNSFLINSVDEYYTKIRSVENLYRSSISEYFKVFWDPVVPHVDINWMNWIYFYFPIEGIMDNSLYWVWNWRITIDFSLNNSPVVNS